MDRDHDREHEELRMELNRLRDRLEEAERSLGDVISRLEQVSDQAGASTEVMPE